MCEEEIDLNIEEEIVIPEIEETPTVEYYECDDDYKCFDDSITHQPEN